MSIVATESSQDLLCAPACIIVLDGTVSAKEGGNGNRTKKGRSCTLTRVLVDVVHDIKKLLVVQTVGSCFDTAARE